MYKTHQLNANYIKWITFIICIYLVQLQCFIFTLSEIYAFTQVVPVHEHPASINPTHPTNSSESKVRDNSSVRQNDHEKLGFTESNCLYTSVLLSWWPGSFSLSLVTKPFFGGVVGLVVSVSPPNSAASADFLWPGSFSFNLVKNPSFLAPCLAAEKKTTTTLKIRIINKIGYVQTSQVIRPNPELCKYCATFQYSGVPIKLWRGCGLRICCESGTIY